MSPLEFWKESVAIAAEECGLTITAEQLEYVAEAMEGCHDNYGLSFYQPPWTERISDIEDEWKAKLAAKDRELERYRTNAETAIKEALRQNRDANVTIGEYGEVFRHGGRTEQIQ